jgi:MoaA/NifB/PqqE/SkfB family radical SAM enzyme
MCGHYGDTGVRPNYREELSVVEIKKILNDVSKFSPFIVITGGEPFVRKDIIQILELFIEIDIKFGILTNGTLINKDIAEKLVKLNPAFINISVDGPQKIHEMIRGPNTFNRTIEGIKFLKSYGYSKITINYVISKMNFGYLDDMADLSNGLDVNLQFQHLQFTDKKRDDRHREKIKEYFNINNEDRTSGLCFELNDIDRNKLKEQINKINRNNRIKFHPSLNLDEIERYYFDLDGYTHSEYCIYPWKEARINPFGEITYCIMEHTSGCLLNSSFKEVWNNKNMRTFRKTLRSEKLFPNCARCCKI